MAELVGMRASFKKVGGGYFLQIRDDEVLRESIRTIVSTRPGERWHLPEFGCRVQEALFEPLDDVAAAMAELFVRGAITRWEPRVELLAVKAVPTENRLNIHISYRRRGALEPTLSELLSLERAF